MPHKKGLTSTQHKAHTYPKQHSDIAAYAHLNKSSTQGTGVVILEPRAYASQVEYVGTA